MSFWLQQSFYAFNNTYLEALHIPCKIDHTQFPYVTTSLNLESLSLLLLKTNATKTKSIENCAYLSALSNTTNY